VLDLKYVVESRERVVEMLARRGQKLDTAQGDPWALDAERRQALQGVETLRHRQRVCGEEIARLGRSGGDATPLKTEMKGVAEEIKSLEVRLQEIEEALRAVLLTLPNVPDESVYAWPNLLLAELFVFVLTVSVILLVSLAFNAPLEEPVNVMHPPNPAKAPWYFLGLQEMVSYSAFWGGIGIPGPMVAMLIVVPYIDRGKAGVGRWFARERLMANTIFLTLVVLNVIFIIIGTFFRGPNWSFVSPF